MQRCCEKCNGTPSPDLKKQGVSVPVTVGSSISVDVHFGDMPSNAAVAGWQNWPISGLSVCWHAVVGGSNNFVRFYGVFPDGLGPSITVKKKNGDPIVTFTPSGGGTGTTGGPTSPSVVPRSVTPTNFVVGYHTFFVPTGTSDADRMAQ